MKPEALNLLYARSNFPFTDDIAIYGACNNYNDPEIIRQFSVMHESYFPYSDMNNLGAYYSDFNSAFAYIGTDRTLKNLYPYGMELVEILQMMEDSYVGSQSEITELEFDKFSLINESITIDLYNYFSSTSALEFEVIANSNSLAVTHSIDENLLTLSPGIPQKEGYITLRVHSQSGTSITRSINYFVTKNCTFDNFDDGEIDDSPFNLVNLTENQWVIADDYSRIGAYSICSDPQMPNSNEASLVASVNIEDQNAYLVFYLMYIGGENGDEDFSLYLDDQLYMTWTTSSYWQRYSMVIPNGFHEIRWTFKKMEWSNLPEARAYLDLISINKILPVSVNETKPDKVNMKAYPNPFNPETSINYTLDMTKDLSINVYNPSGALILSKQIRGRIGFNQSKIDLRDYNSGVYYVQLTDKSNVIGNVKVVLIK